MTFTPTRQKNYWHFCTTHKVPLVAMQLLVSYRLSLQTWGMLFKADAAWHCGWIVFCHTLFVYSFQFWKVTSLLWHSQSLFVFYQLIAVDLVTWISIQYFSLLWVHLANLILLMFSVLYQRPLTQKSFNQFVAKFFEGCPDFWKYTWRTERRMEAC